MIQTAAHTFLYRPQSGCEDCSLCLMLRGKHMFKCFIEQRKTEVHRTLNMKDECFVNRSCNDILKIFLLLLICNNNQNPLLLLVQEILRIYCTSSSGEGKAALRTIRADPVPTEVLPLMSVGAGCRAWNVMPTTSSLWGKFPSISVHIWCVYSVSMNL